MFKADDMIKIQKAAIGIEISSNGGFGSFYKRQT